MADTQTADTVPALPAGFTLDNASASMPDALPPLPAGFRLDGEPSTLSKAIDTASGLVPGAGVVDAAAHFASGAVAPFAGGLTYLATLGLSLDPEAAKAVKEATEDALTYQPRTKTGQQITDTVNDAAQTIARPLSKVVDAASDRAADLHGPAAGAFERTVLEGAPYVLGLGGEKAALGGVVNAGNAVKDAAASVASSAGRRITSPAPAFAGELPPAPKAVAADVAPAPATATPNKHTPAGIDPAVVTGTSATKPPTFEAAPPINAPAETTSPAPLADDVQARRAATLQKIGLKEVRDSAVTGDKKAAAGDYQQSKLDDDGGQVLSGAFTNERAALDNHANKLVADAGGTTGLDETSLHNRGSAILQPLNDLSDHLDGKIGALYAKADERAQGLPLELKSTSSALGDRASFIGTTEGQQLLRGANAYLRQAGIMDDAGTIGNATVAQAERFKQYLNSNWTPRIGRLINAVKDSIDDDVLKSAGEDVYGEARGARRERARLLDEPKGVASLLESSGPEGINRQVNVERVPDTVARMPVDQFSHVIDTLHDMPGEMQPQAKNALGEIRSQFMLRMQEAAQKYKGDVWNNRGVTQYLNNNAAKLAKVFSPAELQQIRLLNDAGNVLDVDRSYPGAAVQGHNLAARGALLAIHHGATGIGEVIGSSLGAPGIGAMAGGAVGSASAKALGGSLSKKAALKRIRKLP